MAKKQALGRGLSALLESAPLTVKDNNNSGNNTPTSVVVDRSYFEMGCKSKITCWPNPDCNTRGSQKCFHFLSTCFQQSPCVKL